MKRANLPVLVVLAAAGLIAAGWFGHIDSTETTDDIWRQPLPEIAGERTVSQTFVAKGDGLDAVYVLVATFARLNTSVLHVSLTRLDSSPPSVVVESRVPTARLLDNQYYRLDVPHIDDSAGKPFLLTLTSPNATADNAVTLWSLPANVYRRGALFVDGREQPGDLSFKLRYRPRIWDFLTANPSPLLKIQAPADAPGLTAIWLLALASAAAAIGAVAWVARRDSDESAGDFGLSLALAAGLLVLVGLWIASGRL